LPPSPEHTSYDLSFGYLFVSSALTGRTFVLQVFESLAELISELDVLLSFADLASSCPTPYTRPDITSSVPP
jgi:DNA mismatch repair ATPase MutS